MVASAKSDGPLIEPVTIKISRRLLRAAEVMAMVPGKGSRSEILRGLICPMKQQELLDEAEQSPNFTAWRGRRRLDN